MNFYKDEENVKKYIEMAEGYDGKYLIEILKNYLPEGSSVLELGMGPGKDLNILNKYYDVTGSDYSKLFLDLYREKFGNMKVDLLVLDARTMDISKTFDCIYSNKVLYHLTKKELRKSLNRQWELLNEEGILFHSFWKGDKIENQNGLNFVYYTEEKLKNMIGDNFEIVDIESYKEMEDDDSLYIILKKK